MSKPSTPVRRSKVGPGRQGNAGGEIPLTTSMEVLTPDPCVQPHLATPELDRSQDLYAAPAGSKPRTPGSATLVRTRSTDGRRSALSGPHEVISLNTSTSKSFSANQMLAHPLVLPATSASPACSIIAVSAAGPLPAPSPYAGAGPTHGVTTPSGAGSSGTGEQLASQACARARTATDMAVSTASSRFNPVADDDEDLPPFSTAQQQERLQQQQRPSRSNAAQPWAEPVRESRVVLGGSASTPARRAASSSSGGGSHRYAAADSMALSMQQRPQTGEGEEGGNGGGGPVPGRFQRDESEVPGTPGSVASGRVGGVFFTDLHRSFGDRTPLGLSNSEDLRDAFRNAGEDGGEDGGAGPRASRQGRISTMTSRLNPMQSPTTSEDGGDDGDEGDAAFAEYAGEVAAGRAGAAEASNGRRGSTSAMTDYTNPVQTPCDSRLPTPLLPSAGAAPAPEPQPSTKSAAVSTAESRQSLLLVIRDLYITEPTARSPADPCRPATVARKDPSTPMAVEVPEPDATPAEERQDDGEGSGGDAATDGSDAVAVSRALVAALAARADSQQLQRRSELGEYMTSLQDLKDESGAKLVELPVDWGVMLERLFRQRRSEFATLEGWMGPRRFEDLPINQLPSDHPDPRVEEGLARIRELDSVLNDKLIAALISHRETFPEQWAEQERKRLERHTKAVEDALKRERQKRLRAARISRAVTSLNGPALAADASTGGGGGLGGMGRQDSSRSLAEQPSIYSRLFTLKPEEEALVEAVLQRNDEEGAAINPFDLESAATYGAGPEPGGGGVSTAGGDGGGAWADADDIDLELDMFLPSASASACATPSAPAPLLRPLSARRLTEADGGGNGLRPLSAASYSSASVSRPGTSSGGNIGGMSALAAAALHGHPVLLAAAGALRASAAGGGGGGSGCLLPERVYEDPRVAARALRAINARLAAFESEHLWDESGSLADFKLVTGAAISQGLKAQQQQPVAEASGPDSAAAVGASPGAPPASSSGSPGARAGASGGGSGRAASPLRSVKSFAGGPAGSVSGVSVTAGGHRDYLREERLAKELASRERDVDAALRSLKTGVVVRLGEATLKALVEQCRRLQELNEHRRKIEEAEAAARKAQLQRQQLMASRASEAGSGRGTPRGVSSPSSNGGSRGQTPPMHAATRSGVETTSGERGAAAGGRATKPVAGAAAAAGSPRGGATEAGAAAASPGAGGWAAGAAQRQSSAGKSCCGSSSAAGELPGPPPPARRASDPATTSSPGAATSEASAAANKSGSKAGRASASSGTQPLALIGAGAHKSRPAGKAAGQLSLLDGGGGLPPPPPPPPP